MNHKLIRHKCDKCGNDKAYITVIDLSTEGKYNVGIFGNCIKCRKIMFHINVRKNDNIEEIYNQFDIIGEISDEELKQNEKPSDPIPIASLYFKHKPFFNTNYGDINLNKRMNILKWIFIIITIIGIIGYIKEI